MKKIPDNEYKYILENMPISCVDLIVFHEGKVLLVRRNQNPSGGELSVPGGRILKNETFVEAVKRKAKEEVGLDVRITKKVGFFEFFDRRGMFKDLKTGIHSVTCVFVVTLTKKDFNIKLDETSSEFVWITKIEDDLIPYVKEILSASGVFEIQT